MKQERIFNVFEALLYMVLLAAILAVGGYSLKIHWGDPGEFLAGLSIVAAYGIPFMATCPEHPFHKNIKKSTYITVFAYVLLLVFYGLGLACNKLFGIETCGPLTALLGIGILCAFNAFIVLMIVLIKRLRTQKKH